MKQNKTLKVEPTLKQLDSVIVKVKAEIEELEKALADKKDYLEQLEIVRSYIEE